jgi:ATPase subunit of ABC transporter with duplicated ATPase domains
MSPIQPIVARGVDRSYGDRRILNAVDITVPPGARTGLIGENGVGKSTLLRILAGVEEPDDGSIRRPVRMGFLWQEAPVDEAASIRDLLDEYTAELRAIENELEDAAANMQTGSLGRPIARPPSQPPPTATGAAASRAHPSSTACALESPRIPRNAASPTAVASAV